MSINIILPYKEKFTKNKASSVSITVRNNFQHSKYKKFIRIFGQSVENPMYEKNFFGIKRHWNFFRSKNENIAIQMCNMINSENSIKQIIEIHNRPYLVNLIKSKISTSHKLTLFLHNDPLEMKGSKSIADRLEILSKSDKIYCVSEYIKNRFLEGLPKKSKKVVVLHNGVKRLKTKPKLKQKLVIFVGRIVKDKGVHLFVNAISEIYDNFHDWNFKIIGSPKLGINKFDKFSCKIKNHFEGLGSRAKMVGFVNSTDLKKIMKKTSIIVIPSIWEEPFGLVAAEAMSNGIAIIASRVGGLSEVVRKRGFLLKNIDQRKICQKLKLLMNNPDLLTSYQKKSFENLMFDSKITSSILDKYRDSLFFEN